VGLRNQLRRLEHTLWGQRSSFELRDGPTYWYYEDEVWSTVFRHGTASLDADYKGEPRPEPPDVLKAVVHAKDRRAALERLYAPGCTPFYAYDPDALVERGEFVPLSFLTGVEYGEEYFERLAKISGRSAPVVS